MTYQDGILALNNVDTEYSVVFGTPFGTTPDVITLQVNNTVDGTPNFILAQVRAKSTTGFDLELDQVPDSNNYVLSWIATQGSTSFEVVSDSVRKLSQTPHDPLEPGDLEMVPFVQTAPVPHTVHRRWEDLRSFFLRHQATPPAAPLEASSAGSVSYDTNYLYLQIGAQWARIPMQVLTSWASDYTLNDRRTGLETLANGTQEHTITFATAFGAGELPVPRTLQVFNDTDDPVTVVSVALVTDITLSQFTTMLTAETDSTNFKLHYEFEQPPA